MTATFIPYGVVCIGIPCESSIFAQSLSLHCAVQLSYLKRLLVVALIRFRPPRRLRQPLLLLPAYLPFNFPSLSTDCYIIVHDR